MNKEEFTVKEICLLYDIVCAFYKEGIKENFPEYEKLLKKVHDIWISKMEED